MESQNPSEILIITPVFDDWQSLARLLYDLDSLLRTHKIQARVLAIDDGSSLDAQAADFSQSNFSQFLSINILHLNRNIGHQRAITIGLSYANANGQFDQVIVMDSDGEDRPGDIFPLILAQQKHPEEIVFVQRSKRSDSIAMRFFYTLYKWLFFLLTGKAISFGNFSSIPASSLKRVVSLSEIWNHYAAGVMHSNMKWTTIPMERGRRYFGASKMNFVTLLLHGLSAISVYMDVVAVRLILAITGLILLDISGFAVLLYIRYFTNLAIPGWATTVAIGLFLILMQAVMFLAILTFAFLNGRSQKLFIPARDYLDFVDYKEQVFSHD